MEELSLHILDIAENSIAAGAKRVDIRIGESRREDLLSIEIADDGSGMREDVLQKATDPFFTSRTTRRVGLGLPLFEQAARAAGGECRIVSRPGSGTTVTGVFRYSHVDRQPLGDIAETLLTLVVGNPGMEFTCRLQTDDADVFFSTAEMEAELRGAPIHSPAGIAAVRKSLERLREGVTHAVGSR
ncbi:MAG: ATP-binding protein [Bryobacteraceae bacterium]